MGDRTVEWLPTAQRQFDAIATWYLDNVGTKAMQNFVKDTSRAVRSLSFMPTIGMVDKRRSTAKVEYRSFVSHKMITILYRYTNTTLTIVALRYNKMNSWNSI